LAIFAAIPLRACSFVTKKIMRPYDALHDGALRADGAIGCEHFGIGGLIRIEADTTALQGCKSRKSTRFAPERLRLLRLPR
jgi:hypothetical protein